MARELELRRIGKGKDSYWSVYNTEFGYYMMNIPNGSLEKLIKKAARTANKKVKNTLKLRISTRKTKEMQSEPIVFNPDIQEYEYGTSAFYACRSGMKGAIGSSRPKKIYFNIVS
jgi:hypothetical protein